MTHSFPTRRSSDLKMKILGLMSAVAVTGLIASPAVAQTLSLKFGHVGEPGSLFEASANEFARCANADRSEEHTSELQSLMRISYAVFCLKNKTKHTHTQKHTNKDTNTTSTS